MSLIAQSPCSISICNSAPVRCRLIWSPGRGLRDIVSSPHRVDALMIASSTVPESDNFSILGAEEAIDEVVPIEGSAITALLKEMRSNFDFIIVDLPRHMFASHKRLLATSQEIVIVSDLTLAGIRDTLRIKSALVSLGCTARITIVASRTNASGAGHIDRAAFEKGDAGQNRCLCRRRCSHDCHRRQ